MSYPTFQQYDEALQSPSLALLDPELKAGVVKKNGLGLPLALCGGFALTYTLSYGSKKYAVRCFHKKSNALELRYNAIARKLRALSSDYFLNFEFQPNGIRVNNDYFPVVKMAWGAGEELGVFIENNFNHKSAIQNLKRSFLSLYSCLFNNGIAHGDLQSGNIMISNSGLKLKLIDYDGMFVDEIKNLGNSECGHKNFQHPQRTSQFDKYLDRFSFISVYLALQALEHDKALWAKSKPDGESIIFKANDYAKPGSSAIFSILFSKPELSQAVKNFAAICESPYETIPSLDDFIIGRNIPQQVITISSQPAEEVAQSYISQYPTLDAGNYSLCQHYVGDRVELIGQIIAIREGKTKYGKPYIFVNFGDWKKESLKINIWSEALEKLKIIPSKSWVGKWVSVVGLMDPPYTGTAGKDRNKHSYTNLSITLSESNQLYIIDEKEAKYRLNSSDSLKSSSTIFSQSSSKNEEITLNMGPRCTDSSATISGGIVSNNVVILHQMQRRTPGSNPQSSNASVTPQQTSSLGKRRNNTGRLPWAIILVVIFVVIMFLVRFWK